MIVYNRGLADSSYDLIKIDEPHFKWKNAFLLESDVSSRPILIKLGSTKNGCMMYIEVGSMRAFCSISHWITTHRPILCTDLSVVQH